MVFQTSTNQYQETKYIVDATAIDSPYNTIQAALDAANTAGGNALVYVRSGVYTEDLTLYDTIFLQGEIGPLGTTEGTRLVGTHTPPATGAFTIDGFTLVSATDIFNSAVAGSTNIYIERCIFEVTNGFIFNLLNWTGLLNINDCGENSTNNGIANNTGGADFFTNNSQIGAGVGQTFVANGDLRFDLTFINCPATFTGGGIFSGNFLLTANPMSIGGTKTATISDGSTLGNTLTTADTATLSITNTQISTGANAAISHGSANSLTLADVNIDSTNPPPIEGAGAGDVIIGSITFLQEDGFAGTLTLNRSAYLEAGTLRSALSYHMGIGAGAQSVIEITPDTAIGGVEWDGIEIDGSALDPTAVNAIIHGVHIDFSGVSLVNDPEMEGLDITMPVAFSGDTEKAALYARGFGYEVELCSGDHDASVMCRGRAVLDFDATGAVAGDSLAGFQYNIDETGSTGGELHVLNVSTTGDGTVEAVALGVNPGAGVIHHHTGAFAATDQSWKFNGGFTDVTAAFDNPAVDVTIFDNDNDYIYIGSNAVFSQIRVILATNAGKTVFPVFEYSIGGPAWTAFSPIDGTSGFVQSGVIEFDSADLAGWASVVVNGANHFYIRIQRTRNNIGTVPIEDTIRILQPTLYYWDDAGDVLAASVTAAGLADTTQTQYEIATYAASGVLDGIGPLTDGQLIIGDTGGVAVAASISNGNNITWTSGAGTLEADLTGTTNHTVQVGNATGSLTSLAAATNGQLVIGSTGADPAIASLASADGSVTITPGAGTIDLAAAGGGLTWSVETGAAKVMVVDEGYITNRGGGVSYTLPTTAAVGSVIRIAGLAGLWSIVQNVGESINFGLFTTTVGAGGSLVATNANDAIEILCIVADTTWQVLSSIGNITVN